MLDLAWEETCMTIEIMANNNYDREFPPVKSQNNNGGNRKFPYRPQQATTTTFATPSAKL
jgi:hypothetical protein